MRKLLALAAALVGAAAPALAQTGQAAQQYSARFELDGLYRYEWTRDIFGRADPNEDRWRAQLRPRVELGIDRFLIGLGGDFNYSSDENTEATPPATRPLLIRDNYASRDARVDLAFLSFKPGESFTIVGGRFANPVGFTEMIWDKDLRPQGAAVTLESKDRAGQRRFALVGLGAQGSHVFDDKDTRMLVGSLEAALGKGLSVTASYVHFEGIDTMEAMIRRQNTRAAGEFVHRYDVVDVVGRIHREGPVNAQLVADYCWNTRVDEANKGLWLALVLGSTQTAKARFEYVYAKVDKDATLAAYATDDFFWATGWEGHRGEVGLRAGSHSAVHAVYQRQRFKDSPRPEERDHWVSRWRAELRIRK